MVVAKPSLFVCLLDSKFVRLPGSVVVAIRCLFVCLFVCLFAGLCWCVYVCVRMCTYVYVCVCMCI